MTLEEWYTLAKALKSAFTQDNFLPDNYSVKLYGKMLEDISTDLATLAVQRCILECKYPPKVSEIRKIAFEIMTEQQTLDWSEGWQEVQKAIGAYGYPREKEALESMSEITADVVRRIGWQNICLSENPMSDRANFRDIYLDVAKRKKEQAMLPVKFTNDMQVLQQRALTGIGVIEDDEIF